MNEIIQEKKGMDMLTFVSGALFTFALTLIALTVTPIQCKALTADDIQDWTQQALTQNNFTSYTPLFTIERRFDSTPINVYYEPTLNLSGGLLAMTTVKGGATSIYFKSITLEMIVTECTQAQQLYYSFSMDPKSPVYWETVANSTSKCTLDVISNLKTIAGV